MTNKEIANAFDQLASLMELHDEDDFRVRTYRNAYITLRKADQPLADMSDAEIKTIKGVGPAIAGKIRELLTKGQMVTLEEYKAKTPPGVVEMLDVNGFGPKKVRIVWREMEIDTIGELLYACNENRLVEYKGFGEKTQEDLKNKLEYFLKSRNKMHLDTAEKEADFACTLLSARLPGAIIAVTGALRRRNPIVETIEILVGYEGDRSAAYDTEHLTLVHAEEHSATARIEGQTHILIHWCAPSDFGSKMFKFTGNSAFIEAFVREHQGIDFKNIADEKTVFEKAGRGYIAPELRDMAQVLHTADTLPALITDTDLKGILHVHTTYSDGIHSLADMCRYVKSLGYQYIGITDHSQSAFYANGLKPDRVLAQMDEIDALNAELAPFRIYKGIESDILNDGNLDYTTDILERFDFIIASVHSNLKMTREKATERVVRAIENPFTTMLGHPTGRLLLSREGYPLDWDAVFDACKKHHVAIELNANPHRLDIDWTLIPEALKHGIKISINPDAHSKDGIHHTRYGVMIARKGGLTPENCYNASMLNF